MMLLCRWRGKAPEGKVRHSCNTLAPDALTKAVRSGMRPVLCSKSIRLGIGGGRRVLEMSGPMTVRKLAFVFLGLMLGGCMQSTLEPASDANLKPRDRQLLANAPYAPATIPEPYRRHIVEYHRKEAPGTIVIDPDARYLYYVLANHQAIR